MVTQKELSTSIIGLIRPEAFLNHLGELISGIDYSKIGAIITATEQGTSRIITGTVNNDGSFVIEGLLPDWNYDLELRIPGHLRSRIQQFTVGMSTDFGILLVGDVDQNDVIDLKDLYVIARYFGVQKLNGQWMNEQAALADLNQDGVVDVLDVSLLLHNFGKTSIHVDN
jgi:hypothetical protein